LASTSKLIPTATLALAVLSIAACSAPQAREDSATGICRPEAASALAGKNRIGDAEARQSTGASLVRQLKPGQPATMDYRRERVTIETDPATGKIVRAACG
jgi:hypothetical protein